MHIKGITYDTGFINAGVSTKEKFDPKTVQREMQIIKNDLHCNAVRVTGGDNDRLETTAQLAAAESLQIWYCPFTCDLTQEQLLQFLLDGAQRAEKIRSAGADVVFVTGSEISFFTKGFFPGDNLTERLDLLKDPMKLREHLPFVRERIKEFLARAVQGVRKNFHGKISYASIPYELVDWNLFDYVATDGGYRTKEMSHYFAHGIRNLVNMGKPAVITEFGATTYQGGSEKGARADMIIEWENGRAKQLDNVYSRDEYEQADYILELFELFEIEKVHGVFVNTFARYDLPHRNDPRVDLDMASCGIVKVFENRMGTTYPDMHWEPKKAFYAIAERYAH